MNILGITLKTPTAKSLLAVLIVAVLAGSLIVGMFGWMFPDSKMDTPLVGVLGGAVAAAYGVNVGEQGWRGFVVMMGFVIVIDTLWHGILFLMGAK